MSQEKTGIDNPPAYTADGNGFSAQYGGTNPPQGMAYPQQGGQGMGYPPPQQGMGYPPPQQVMGYPPQPGYGQQMQSNTTAVIVNEPGPPGFVVLQPRPSTYMLSSILACIFCFWPTGLCAICFACQTNKLSNEGDMVGAASMANKARNLMITTIVLGIIWLVMYRAWIHDWLYRTYIKANY